MRDTGINRRVYQVPELKDLFLQLGYGGEIDEMIADCEKHVTVELHDGHGKQLNVTYDEAASGFVIGPRIISWFCDACGCTGKTSMIRDAQIHIYKVHKKRDYTEVEIDGILYIAPYIAPYI